MTVPDPTKPPYVLYYSRTNTNGLYSITPEATVYVGKDLTGSYKECNCKVIALLYSNLFITDQAGLIALSMPEPGKKLDHIQKINNF